MFLYLVQQNIINGDWPISAVEDQHHSIVIEIDGPQKDIHHSPAVVLVIDIPLLQCTKDYNKNGLPTYNFYRSSKERYFIFLKCNDYMLQLRAKLARRSIS